MIFDAIKNMENYRDYPELYQVLTCLAKIDESNLPEKTVIIKKDEVFYNTVEFVSKPEQECKYEAHRKFMDIHYIVSGAEQIATADVKQLNLDTQYDEQKDIAFYTGNQSGRYILTSGDFMVCYPSDAHKVAMMIDKPDTVKKIVVKVRVPEYKANIYTNEQTLDKIKGSLVVSCQALADEPLHSSFIMGRMALAAKQGGALGIRANSPEDIKEIQKQVDLPIIGIIKRDYDDSAVYITPTMREIDELMEVKPQIIALDATSSLRPNGQSIDIFFKDIKKKYPSQLFMADCSTVEEAIHAYEIGFDFVGTTLVGYTKQSRGLRIEDNDFEIIRTILQNVKCPVIAEGNINTPEKVKRVLELGCYSVVVGSIITRPQLITKSFSKAIDELKN